MSDRLSYVNWFRDASPYINTHRGKTFVIHLSGEAIACDNFMNIVSDLVLLNSLGIQLVVVYGATPQIDAYLNDHDLSWTSERSIRITTPEILPAVQHAVGHLKVELEAALSRGVINAPLQVREILTASGNHIKARPLGIIDGVDFHNTGAVRKVNTSAIRGQLESGAIVLLPPTGYSPTGEVFNIHSVEVAGAVAAALHADKLLLFTADQGLMDSDGNFQSEMQVADLGEAAPYSPAAIARDAALRGVERCHLVSFNIDGALLEELFTRDGSGTQIVRQSYERTRIANSEDVAGIIELIAPLEEAGVLVKRSRELIESEISHFSVIDRDGMIVGCAALYPYGTTGELACLVTHPDYRDNNRGEALLKAIEQRARQLNLEEIFVLTTQTAHWFVEHGFSGITLEHLPVQKQALYNFHRNSKLFAKALT